MPIYDKRVNGWYAGRWLCQYIITGSTASMQIGGDGNI